MYLYATLTNISVVKNYKQNKSFNFELLKPLLKVQFIIFGKTTWPWLKPIALNIQRKKEFKIPDTNVSTRPIQTNCRILLAKSKDQHSHNTFLKGLVLLITKWTSILIKVVWFSSFNGRVKIVLDDFRMV